MSEDIRKMIDNVKNFKQFINENIENDKSNAKFIYNHIEKTNSHSSERDAFQGIPSLNRYNWNIEPVLIYPNDEKIDKDMLYPASKMDVKRYMKAYKNGSEFPPIVLVDNGNRYSIFDGSHRLQAAINLDVPIKAYIGYKK